MLWVWGGLAGWAVQVLRVHVDVWVVLGGLDWAGRRRVVPWVRGGPWVVVGACGGGILRWVSFRWCLGGLQTEMGGVCWVWSRLVDFLVMHGMVMDETQHVFPGGGVGELLRVCQQEVFAVYHLCCCSADCFFTGGALLPRSGFPCVLRGVGVGPVSLPLSLWPP